MDVYVLEWDAKDLDDSFEVRAFGKTPDGRSACVRIAFYPYFFVDASRKNVVQQRAFLTDCVLDHGANERYSLPVTRKDIWGYSEGPKPMLQLAFDTLKRQRICRSVLAKRGLQTYEGTVDPVVRLAHVRKIPLTGWIRVEHCSEPEVAEFPRSDVEVCVEFANVGPSALDKAPPLVLCSWDLEVYSHDGSFPSPDVPENPIVQIACSFQRLGDSEPYRNVVLCLKETSPIENADILWFDSETEMLDEWQCVLDAEKVDVMMGWNTWNFDWNYVARRAAVLTDDEGNSLVDLTGLGRGPDGAGATRDLKLASNAYGENKFTMVRMPGVLDLDLMQLARRDFKLPSYSLNNVSKTFLGGESKIDLPAAKIFEKFRGTPDDRADIAKYAVQDVLLPLKLFAKLNVFNNLAQMSVATCVPVSYLLTRGQQIKVFSLILKQAKDMGFVIPDDKALAIEGKFEGATVLEAKKGAYFDVISGLDFASLYPSILRSYNMCYSTLVLPGSPEPPPDQVYAIQTDIGTFRYAQHVEGVVPKLLENLAVWRKDAKKKMAACKAAGDAFGESLWNGAQLAFKVSMNSVYGFLGASKGMFPCVSIAASVTATGTLIFYQGVCKNL